MACALSPVSAAVFTLLNVQAILDLAPGGIHDAVPQGVQFPFVFFEVSDRQFGGFGTKGLPEVEIRVHAYSTEEGMKQAQTIIDKAIELLEHQSPAVAGYRTCSGIFHDDDTPLPNEVINGVPCRELVAFFRIYVEEV